VVVTVRGRPLVVMAFTVAAGQFVEIAVIGDPDLVCRIASAIEFDA
jgi:hypothetical protein